MEGIVLGSEDRQFLVADSGFLQELLGLLGVVGIVAGEICVVGVARVEEGRADRAAAVGDEPKDLMFSPQGYR